MSDAVARKRYSAEFKRHAVAQLDGCTNVTALAARLGIRRKFLYAWRDQFTQFGEAAFTRGLGRPPKAGTATLTETVVPPLPAALAARERQIAAQQERIARLERQLGQKQLEVEFFKQTFAHVRGAMAAPTSGGAPPSTPASTPGSRAKGTS